MSSCPHYVCGLCGEPTTLREARRVIEALKDDNSNAAYERLLSQNKGLRGIVMEYKDKISDQKRLIEILVGALDKSKIIIQEWDDKNSPENLDWIEEALSEARKGED